MSAKAQIAQGSACLIGVFAHSMRCISFSGENIKNTHHECSDFVCAATLGLNAGMDQELGTTDAIDAMPQALRQGNITIAAIDAALGRQVRTRIFLGMLDPPTMNSWNTLSNATVESPAHLAYARYVAQQTMVLLQNREGTLPLNVQQVGSGITLALIGPQYAHAELLIGNYGRHLKTSLQPESSSACVVFSADSPVIIGVCLCVAVVPNAPGIISIMEGLFQSLGSSAPTTCTSVANFDYLQPGEQGIMAWYPGQCANLCSASTTCLFYTFDSSSNACYLKTNATGGVASPGKTSGACKPQPNLAWSTGCADIPCADNLLFPDALATAAKATHVVVTLGFDYWDLEGQCERRGRRGACVWDRHVSSWIGLV